MAVGSGLPWLAAGLLIVAIAFSPSLVASVLSKRFERPETGHKFLDGLLRASGWHNTKPALCAKDHERRKKGRTRDGPGSRAQQTRINSVPFRLADNGSTLQGHPASLRCQARAY